MWKLHTLAKNPVLDLLETESALHHTFIVIDWTFPDGKTTQITGSNVAETLILARAMDLCFYIAYELEIARYRGEPDE